MGGVLTASGFPCMAAAAAFSFPPTSSSPSLPSPLALPLPAPLPPSPSLLKLLKRHPPPIKSYNARAFSEDRLSKLAMETDVEGATTIVEAVRWALLQFPPTWASSLLANLTIFGLGFPVLQAGLTLPGIAAAYVLGTLTWKAFGVSGFFLVVCYFIAGTSVTRVKIKQKEKEGIAEKRSGKRGPASVIGSGAAGSVCAVAAIACLGGPAFISFWRLGFAASFCTKLSDTVSSEIGKAFGKTTYLVTTFKIVPRGTEGAISIEGTVAGLIASILFSACAYYLHQVNGFGALICVLASQLANVFESYAGAFLQDKEGFEWVNNDVVNIMNVTIGATLAIVSGQLIG